MGATTRHYKALMKKNCINWKRTPCGSICEIVCPLLLMFILVYARSRIDLVDQENFSLYSLRRPLYPIAKPEINDKFTFSISDQVRQGQNYEEFLKYMDVKPLSVKISVSTDTIIKTVEEVADEVTGIPEVFTIVEDIKNDIRNLTNLAHYIEQTPIKDFNEKYVAWDAFEKLIEALGLNTLIDVPEIKAYVEENIQEEIEDPNKLIADYLSFDLSATVEATLAQVKVPNLNELKELGETLDLKIEGYIPILDVTGPYAFFPSHCYPSGVLEKDDMNDATQYNSPVIAYVKTGASIEKDIINQLQSLFEAQKNLPTLISSLDLIAFLGDEANDIKQTLSKQFGLPDGALDNEDLLNRFGGGEGEGPGPGPRPGKGQGGQDGQGALDVQNLDLSGIQINFSDLMKQVPGQYIREEEITAVGKQIENRFKINTTDIVESASDEIINNGTDFFSSTRALGNFKFKEFASQAELDDYISDERIGQDPEYEGVCFGFSITENEDKNKYELDLYFNDQWPRWLRSIPNQKKPVWNSYEYTPQTDEFLKYTQNGFSYLQNWVANTILKRKTGIDTASIVAMVVPSKLPPYVEDDFARLLTGVFSFFVIIMYVPPIYRTSYRIVQEKENKVKESMRMMGLGDFAYWASWFTYYTVVNSAISLLTWVIMITSIMQKSEPWILFFVIWLYGQSLFGIILITQSLFTKARAAAITTSIIYFGTSTFQYFVREPDIPLENRIYASLSPTVAMIQTVAVLAQYEGSQVGSKSENLFAEFNNFTVGHGLVMMAVDCVWVIFLGFYLEMVMPKTFGRRRHPCFCFTRSFWGCKSRSRIQQVGQTRDSDDKDVGVNSTFAFETKYINPDCYEKLSPEIDQKEIENQVLKITGLHKEYENGFKAVNGINVKMYADQIFCLLGHNGAGKTTTISMLTGLLRESQGEANLFGTDLFNRMDEARKVMGVCPQHDVLFDLLTPEEHLDIFYEFKGADKTNKKKEIEQMLHDIGVDDKKKNLAYQLSGGNKRKLSVAIALCGNSKFVLLDEPTSGLDIQARRQLWNMLRAYKKDKIILLTTHYMDEADILGDRIGIMTQGKMTCLGSSMFLKNRFGVGYVMTIVKKKGEANKKVMPYLTERLGDVVSKLSEIQGEMTVQIPRECTVFFKSFFSDFDADLEMLDIQSYGMSVTTLEQVFLEIGHDPNPKPKFAAQSSSANANNQGEIMNTPSENGNSTPNLASGLVKKQLDKTDNGDGTNLNSDRRLVSDKQQASFLPPIDTAVKGGIDILENANISNIGGREDSLSGLNIDHQIEEEKKESTPNKPSRLNPQDLEAAKTRTPGFSKNNQDENFEKFNLSESKLDLSFCNNFKAVLSKRFNSYRRAKKRVFTEIFLPSAFMVFGVWISSLDFSFRSNSRLIEPSMYPLKQQLLINENVYDSENSDLQPQIFAENLPEYESSFDVKWRTEKPGKTFDDFGEDVFQMGIQKGTQEPYIYSSYEIYQADSVNHEYKFVSYVNMTSPSGVSIFPQFMYESILKVATQDPEFEFRTRSVPYPRTYEMERRIATSDAGSIIFFAAIAYSIVITVTVSYLVVERSTQLKHVQVITGMRLSSYWIANFIFDSIKLYVTIATTIALFFAFDQQYESAEWVFAAFPFGIIPFTYVMSFLFTADSAAQTFTMFCHMVIILAFSTLIFIIRVVPDLELLGDNLHYAMRIFPSYSIATALYTDASLDFISQIRNSTPGDGPDISEDVWDIKNNLLDLIMMFAHLIFWFTILFLIEVDLGKRIRKCWQCCCKRLFPKKDQTLKLDQDVVNEANRVAVTPNEQLKIKVEGLRKVYEIKGSCCAPMKPLVAVENISFGLEAGECFALLGVNGAGKSTTFKSLTSEVEPTEGTIHIGSLDIRKDFNKIKKMIGYCPQTNPIFEYMSVEENIEYFARIKGIPFERRAELCDRAIKQLDLEDHRKKMAGALSGGNKRKLSVALAIVGSPPIILLDEPSAGMDPEARRFMWRVVSQIASDKTSAVILTTHSMEEAEALSTKMGIMVKGGVFKCFGTPQHIKDKFGTGFVIEIKAQTPIQEEIDEVRESILNPDSVEDPLLKQALKRPFLTAEETSKILTASQVPGIVIESILNLDVKLDSDQNEEEAAEKILRKQFTLNDIAQEIFVKGALFGVIESLCQEFVNVEVIEQYGSYMRLRVERHNKSIGFLFKLIEELKEEHQLEDYSVSQTTLEQIFQGFADLNFNENVPTFCIDEESGELAKILFE